MLPGQGFLFVAIISVLHLELLYMYTAVLAEESGQCGNIIPSTINGWLSIIYYLLFIISDTSQPLDVQNKKSFRNRREQHVFRQLPGVR